MLHIRSTQYSMMARLNNSLIFLFLHILSLKSPPCEGTTKPRHYSPAERRHAALFVFGDSFLDSGNNNYINTTTLDQANFFPYGETFFGYPTGRFSDGRLISDFVAEFANLPLIPPFLQPGFRRHYDGVNFASAGAGCLVETFRGSVIDLQTQLRYFKKVETLLRDKLGSVGAEVTLSKAVYLFSIGTNDYMSLFLTNSTILNHYSKSQYVGMVISNFTAVIKEIYTIGGRKFGVINLPNFGCFPGIISNTNGSCLKEASSLIKSHNRALSEILARLEKELNGFKYSLYDFNSNMRHLVNHPSKNGFKEGKTACCGTGKYRGVFSCGGKRFVKEYQLCENPNQHVFWDSYHLTENAYKHFAHHMWIGSGSGSGSANNLSLSLRDLFQSD